LSLFSVGALTSGARPTVLGRQAYVWFSSSDPFSSSSPWPGGPTTAIAAAVGRRSIVLQPGHLAYDAELMDTLMFMAQLCLDFYRDVRDHGGDWLRALQANSAGKDFASYALTMVASRSALLVHEFGHMYLGGIPHCGFDVPADPSMIGPGGSRWRSCFDVARRALWARVVAENGLPVEVYVAGSAVDARVSGTAVADISLVDWSGVFFNQLANPFWKTVGSEPSSGLDLTARGVSCGSAVSGTENSPHATDLLSGMVVRWGAACLGRSAIELIAPRSWGSGYAFRVTNGCNCSVAADVGSDGGLIPVTSGACYSTFSAALGVHSVPAS
jgi:hypothetical protein